MTIQLPRDYWIEIPGGRYTVGLLPAEARQLAEQSAAWFQHHGPEWSSNDVKLLRRHSALEKQQGNPEWVERYLLAHFPAREVTIEPFAIARYPVTNELYRRFTAETGECIEPASWSRGEPFTNDDRPPRGIAWAPAVALAEWAGARLPFEDEWERAVRGPDRWLFPWGNDLAPTGWNILDDQGSQLWRVDATCSPEGVSGALIGMPEWCADRWEEAPGLKRGEWGEVTPRAGGRPTRGGLVEDVVVPAAVTRQPSLAASYLSFSAGVRLVRRDARAVPQADPAAPAVDRQNMLVREFEVRVLNPALEALIGSRIAEDHSVRVEPSVSRDRPDDPAVAEITRAASRTGWIRQRSPENAEEHVHGMTFVATSKESMRRHPPQHGVFASTVEYRYPEDGRVMVRSVTAYRMAFDRGIHRFVSGFRANEQETPLEEVTTAMVEKLILDAFWFYERFADSDRSPF